MEGEEQIDYAGLAEAIEADDDGQAVEEWARRQGLRAERAALAYAIDCLDGTVADVEKVVNALETIRPLLDEPEITDEQPPNAVPLPPPERHRRSWSQSNPSKRTAPKDGAVTRGRRGRRPTASQQISFGAVVAGTVAAVEQAVGLPAGISQQDSQQPEGVLDDAVPETPSAEQIDAAEKRMATRAAPAPVDEPPARSAEAYERRQSRAAVARHHAQVEADRARQAAGQSPPPPPETRSRFSQASWEEAELINPMRLQHSDSPVPAHRLAELRQDLPSDVAGRPFGIGSEADILEGRKRGAAKTKATLQRKRNDRRDR